jgi:hypothetical protein
MNNIPCKSLGIAVARLVYRGLVSEARVLAGTRNTWTVPEARAIIGAGRSLQTRFGADGLTIAKSVMGWV